MNPPASILSSQPPAPLPADAVRILRFALHRRRRGKIAALPQAAREQINRMLADGLRYQDIIARLGEAGQGLTKHCLSRWHKRSFQDWRAVQLHAATSPPRNQAAADVRTVLMQLDPETLDATIKADPAKLAPLIKAIARIVVACTGPNPS